MLGPITKIGSRGLLYTFPAGTFGFETSVYAVNCSDFVLLCDTHLGPLSMEPVTIAIHEQFGEKPIVVFNTHADYDHIWGNCAFPDVRIISHKDTVRMIRERGKAFLDILRDYTNGIVVLTSPNETFSDNLTIPREKITLIHTPGHTCDSSSLFDEKDGVLFCGDTFEDPLPCVAWHEHAVYVDTIQKITAMNPSKIISSHSGIVTPILIEKNRHYISALAENRQPELEGRERASHMMNRKFIYSSLLADQLRNDNEHLFDSYAFTVALLKNVDLPYDEFKLKLDAFIPH